jgi:hypothetical protein
MGTDDIQLHVLISRDLHRKLVVLAEKEGRSPVSSVVRRALEDKTQSVDAEALAAKGA